MSKKIEDFIINNHKIMTINEICEKTNLKYNTIIGYLCRLNLSCLRNSKSKVKHNYFKNINHNSAYILGFTMADGCVNNFNTWKIGYCLHSKDIEVLEFIKKEVAPESIIHYYRENEASLTFSSKFIFEDMSYFGIIPNKTGKEKLLNIDKQYFYDYLRGLFDGDGTVGIYDKKHTNYKNYIWSICCSNYDFLEQLRNFEGNNLGNIYTVSSKDKPIYQWTIYKKEDIIHIYNKFYSENNFSLKRKKDKMKEIVNYVYC